MANLHDLQSSICVISSWRVDIGFAVQVVDRHDECSARVTNGTAFVSTQECCQKLYAGKGCRTFPKSCWVKNNSADSPDRTCTMVRTCGLSSASVGMEGSLSVSAKVDLQWGRAAHCWYIA